MPNTPLNGLVMRTAIARQPGMGFIYAADPQKEADEVPHAIIFKYKDGEFIRTDANYDAHSLAIVSQPGPGLIDVSGSGYYSAIMASGTSSGDIFDDSTPAPQNPRTGGIRSVAEIGGVAFAVGLRGMVYRFEGPKHWTRIDDGLPETFNAQAIHGFSGNEIYAVGREGSIWRFDGHHWHPCESPTSVTLTSIKCAPNGIAYIAGHRGVLLQGRNDMWSVVDQTETSDDIWDLEWFIDALYVSTMSNVYRLKQSQLEPVDFGDDRPKSCYQLSAGKDVMWSNGEFDLMSFDGIEWTRIV
ncbi:hypothetical protein SAMN04489802_2620 [Pseudomonas chlororaphis]|uniref:WD40/YVTN/BNR-like repeat-containing protein n=1 Tax=Pseudomonas chlororaphis TaxID=587753 RepID=UPI00087B6365|nr:hypothetical protein [Pseudomonas chlororaphis]AZD22915.1 hypothetical protein C4K24_3614 [Pseudomonas chlororaphis subsp. aurantiaca]AZD67789.1 hypothetical protein C4K17_3905 [Pseudomonas chlororaphis subsp. aurantiaca]AZD74012.1 hypothetical protein C4K16_3654 [Pseudomonas chlororaphis subsp. aurantiaca]AZD80236.1 hypothetical protein C4K15_3671 [Pseudomonas chlororaphis subsp. aurantiaca]QIT23738.1 hypothetical protein HCN09_19120 [Pseudomonas chlororaphis subsp. aurantiaca]